MVLLRHDVVSSNIAAVLDRGVVDANVVQDGELDDTSVQITEPVYA